MSAFGNPYGTATADADAYVRRLLDLVGSRDPLELLPELPAHLEELTRGLDDATLRRAESEGKWSMLQTIRHLTDSDVVFAFRYRMIIAQDTPPITGYDQDSWCRQLGYNEADLQQSFELLRVLRRDNLRMLRALTPQERRRGGMHSERGFEDIERLMRLHAAHDIVHSRQIARIRAAVAAEG